MSTEATTWRVYSAPAGMRDDAAFLDAWRRGIDMVGARFFGDGTGAGESKWDLAPRIDDIDAGIGTLSSSQATMLAAMVSIYNSRIGGRLMSMLNGGGTWGLADIVASLEPARRRVIADLILSYPGW